MYRVTAYTEALKQEVVVSEELKILLCIWNVEEQLCTNDSVELGSGYVM